MSLDLLNKHFIIVTSDELTRNILRRTGHNPSHMEQKAREAAGATKSSYLIANFSQEHPYRRGFAVYFFNATSAGWGSVMIVNPKYTHALATLTNVLIRVIQNEQEAKQTPEN